MSKLIVLFWIVAFLLLIGCDKSNNKCTIDITAHNRMYSVDTTDYKGHCILMIKASNQGSFSAIHSPECFLCKGGTK